MLKVGYGAMVLESLLAVIALCVAGAAASANGTPADGTPFQVFSSGVAGFFEMFGIPVYVAQCFMTMCVSALALTSLDAVARIGRMSFQELFSVDDMEHAEGWRKVLCNTYFSTIITLAAAFVLTRIGYANIWPLFGSANQLLSALVLVTLCVFLKVTGRSNKMLFPPLIIMLCVTGTALVERTIGLVKAFCWFRNIFSRRLTADYRYFTDDTWSDHRSKFTPGLLRLKEEFGNLIRQTGKV